MTARARVSVAALALMLTALGCAQAPVQDTPHVGYRVQQLAPRPNAYFLQRFFGITHFDIDASLESRLKDHRGPSRARLTRDERLDAAALVHSAAMAITQTGFQVSPDGKTLEDRIKAQGVTYGWWAGYARDAQVIGGVYPVNTLILRHVDWRVVTNDRVKRYGIGVYKRGNKVYTTLLFTD
ncbi:hypothetical protein D3C72_851560 [compost metagenome]